MGEEMVSYRTHEATVSCTIKKVTLDYKTHGPAYQIVLDVGELSPDQITALWAMHRLGAIEAHLEGREKQGSFKFGEETAPGLDSVTMTERSWHE